MSWEFYAPLIVKSHNVTSRGISPRVRWRQHARQKNVAIMAFRFLKQEHGIPDAIGRRKVIITRVLGHKEMIMDRINYAAGCKPILDAMVAVGLLRDDTEKDVDDYYFQNPADRLNGPQLHIRIEELNGNAGHDAR